MRKVCSTIYVFSGSTSDIRRNVRITNLGGDKENDYEICYLLIAGSGKGNLETYISVSFCLNDPLLFPEVDVIFCFLYNAKCVVISPICVVYSIY